MEDKSKEGREKKKEERRKEKRNSRITTSGQQRTQ